MEGKELGVAVQNGDEQLRLDDGGTWVDLHNGGLHEEADLCEYPRVDRLQGPDTGGR